MMAVALLSTPASMTAEQSPSSSIPPQPKR